MTKRRKICVVLVDRANYGRMKPVMRAIADHPLLKLQAIAGGTMVLERFQQPVQAVRSDGFPVDGEIYIELEGSTPVSMAKSIGFGVVEFASELHRLRPDVVLLIGDRYEALAAAIAAAYLNICICHVQGGEVSGSIDESARHAISKFAHFHFPSTKRAGEYLVRMGERPETVLGIGCPASDLAFSLDDDMAPDILNGRGSGANINVREPFVLVVFHPTTTEYGGEGAQMQSLLTALEELAQPAVMLWPNIDAGSDHIGKAIRVFRDRTPRPWLRLITNLPPEDYLRVLRAAACAVGNSSSFVRDASYFGTPVVLVGNRQDGRETDVHVVRVPPVMPAIVRAVRAQCEHGRYAASTLYGDGGVSPRIAEQLSRLAPYVQKRLDYIHRDPARVMGEGRRTIARAGAAD